MAHAPPPPPNIKAGPDCQTVQEEPKPQHAVEDSVGAASTTTELMRLPAPCADAADEGHQAKPSSTINGGSTEQRR